MNIDKNEFHKNIIQYILSEINSKQYSDDNLESLEVAKQCLETAWGISTNESSSVLLDKLFRKTEKPNLSEKKDISPEDKKTAEDLKAQGNICMGENLYTDAVNCYSSAIEIDPYNAVYYCNRAAAYTKLNENYKAIDDCNKSLVIDSNYSKAYSRMGLAYSAMDQFDEAIKCYKKALDIEPENPNFKQNLMAAQEKKESTSGNPTASDVPNLANMGGFGNLLGNVDVNNILNNPAMMNMAQQFMSRPEMRNMMGEMMQQMMTVEPQPNNNPTNNDQNDGSTNNSAGQNVPLDDFMQFGQRIAQQVESDHPGLVNSLRQRYGAGTNTDSSNPDEDNTDNPPNNPQI